MIEPRPFDREFRPIRTELEGFELTHGLIHVWEGSGPIEPARYRRFLAMLDEDERQRAERFRSELHRLRFVTCRGWLRLLLAAYTGLKPEEIHFETGDHGKPRLQDTPPNSGLVFNVSHSSERTVFGFGLDCMLGVDIERCRILNHLEGMVDRVFSAAEKRDFLNLPEASRAEFFIRLWVRKEAIVKAHGQGISLGMRDCVLSSDLTKPASLPESCGRPGSWTLFELDYSDGYRGALAVNARPSALVRRTLPERLLSLYLSRKLG